MILTSGQTLLHYRLIEQIGEGGDTPLAVRRLLRRSLTKDP
jgi:hypothetical protein